MLKQKIKRNNKNRKHGQAANRKISQKKEDKN